MKIKMKIKTKQMKMTRTQNMIQTCLEVWHLLVLKVLKMRKVVLGIYWGIFGEIFWRENFF